MFVGVPAWLLLCATLLLCTMLLLCATLLLCPEALTFATGVLEETAAVDEALDEALDEDGLAPEPADATAAIVSNTAEIAVIFILIEVRG